VGQTIGLQCTQPTWPSGCRGLEFKSRALELCGLTSAYSEINISGRHRGLACVLLNVWQATRNGFKGTQTSSKSQRTDIVYGLDGMAAISCSRPEHMAVNCLLSWKILQNFIKFISKQAAIVLRPVYSNTAQLESSCVGEVSIATTTQLNWPASRWLAVRCNWVSCIADRRRQLSCVGEGVYNDATQLWVVSL